MSIKQHTDSRMVLTGIPRRRFWMIILSALGLLLSAAASVLIVMIYDESGGLAWPHLPLGLGVVIAQALFWTGVITLAIGRQTLILDTTLGTGDYQVRSPIVDAGRPCRFEFRHVDSVAIETTAELRPGRPGRAETKATVHRVRLRLTKPRRAITLDETEHGQLDRLETLARHVAAFLGQTPVRVDERSDR